jgi:hypothetical protein
MNLSQECEKRKLAGGEWILGAEWITRRVAQNGIIGIIALKTNCVECIVVLLIKIFDFINCTEYTTEFIADFITKYTTEYTTEFITEYITEYWSDFVVQYLQKFGKEFCLFYLERNGASLGRNF